MTRVLVELMPAQAAVRSLLALELFQDSRRAARVTADGALVPLDEQDRSLWNGARIAQAHSALAEAERHGGAADPYRLQARIAAEHAAGDRKDPRAIVRHYDALATLTPSPFVALARAIALGAADGPDAGLAALADLHASGALPGHHYLPAAEADLLRRAGRFDQAASAYRDALDLVRNTAERAFLERRLAEVTTPRN